MQFVHEIINYLTNLPAETWTTLGAYLAGSTLVASLVQVIKHKFKIADAKKLVTSLLGLFSFVAAFVDFIISNAPGSPLPQLGHTTAILVGGAVVVHRFLVSPAYYKLAASLTKFAAFLDTVAEVQAAKKAVNPSDAVSPENLQQFQVQ